ncbi:PIN domain-containing protein [Luteolibacter sp. GHJ8]|uniref:PIN domain-containing protein n=1 Tax=Luteolibacter rhizosphaerae TaxID=2989719 RepID=A0ABT3G937_9BACT|nr:PIN domain-containing protein [Luteolibacter rhizosphaerae]MCW1916362.1 PIN domain-containing protein [Luteolibacter rhizosphaerae]
MTDLVLVDTNVILDVTTNDPVWRPWSEDRLAESIGQMVINPLIYIELCHGADHIGEVELLLASLGLPYLELPREALFLASQAFRSYRLKGGTKSAPLAGFFIGAHAQAEGFKILTRDAGRYRTYFPSVPLICP